MRRGRLFEKQKFRLINISTFHVLQKYRKKKKINYVDEQVPFHAALNRPNVEVEKSTSAAINSYNYRFKVPIKLSPMDD